MYSCETLHSLRGVFVGISYCDMRYYLILNLYLLTALVFTGCFSIVIAKPYDYTSNVILIA